MPEQMDYILVGIGAVGAVLFSSYMPSLVTASGTVRTMRSMSAYGETNTCPCSMTIDNVSGVDLNSLNVCREKGLM